MTQLKFQILFGATLCALFLTSIAIAECVMAFVFDANMSGFLDYSVWAAVAAIMFMFMMSFALYAVDVREEIERDKRYREMLQVLADPQEVANHGISQDYRNTLLEACKK